MAISVILLAYQEEENLRVLLPKINGIVESLNEPYEVVVIDSARPLDKTEEVCIQNNSRYVNQRYPAFGGALRTGIEEAQYDKFLILDSDGSHNPEAIPAIYNAFCSGADMVIGSRYIKGGKTRDAFASICMSKLLNFCFRIVIGVKAKDISTNFRMYHTEQLKELSLDSRNYDILEEIILKLKLRNPGFTIKEVPIDFQKRIYGETKRQLWPFIKSYIKTLFKLIHIRITYKH